MGKVNYVLVNADILPEIYTKVLSAKEFLATGEALSATQAAKMAGISRSAYYKYKDSVFKYNPESTKENATLHFRLRDTKGVLSAVTGELYLVGANVLSINQQIPQNGVAGVTLTMRIAEMTVTLEELIERLRKVNGVKSVHIGG